MTGLVQGLLLVALMAAPGTAVSRILGGTQAAPGEWPEVAAVVYAYGAVGCTGTLVHPELVLTAKHCVRDGRPLQVALDTVDLRAPAGELIAVRSWWEAPDGWEVAVLELEHPARTHPRRVVADCALEALRDGAPATIAGYGATNASATEFSGVLRRADVRLVDTACARPELGCVPGRELVAGGEGTDSCKGDSGGPLYLSTARGVVLAGVTSRGANTGGSRCGQGGIYVRLDGLAPLVESALGRALRRPNCGDNHAPSATVERLSVVSGREGSVGLSVVDVDADDRHRFEVTAPPGHGEASVDVDGTVHYRPRQGFVGEDALTVRVTDDGVPALGAEVRVAVFVEEGVQEMAGDWLPGCSASGAGAAAWLAVALLGVARRRRR